MKIGYARVGPRDQKADLQVDALQKAGCERIYQDIASGAKSARPELDKLLANARAGDALVIWLRLAVENNSKFVRGRKRAKENIERYCLEPLGVRRLESGNYELTVPYQSDEELDKAVHDLLGEISQEAEMRNCFIEADAWEEGTERRW